MLARWTTRRRSNYLPPVNPAKTRYTPLFRIPMLKIVVHMLGSALASAEKFTLPGDGAHFEQEGLQARGFGQRIYRGAPEQNPCCFSGQMRLDDIATKINSEAALVSQKCFWTGAVRKANQDAEDILAVVLDKHFPSK